MPWRILKKTSNDAQFRRKKTQLQTDTCLKIALHGATNSTQHCVLIKIPRIFRPQHTTAQNKTPMIRDFSTQKKSKKNPKKIQKKIRKKSKKKSKKNSKKNKKKFQKKNSRKKLATVRGSVFGENGLDFDPVD